MINFKKTNGWAKTFYILAILFLAATISNLIYGINYITSYIEYGYSFKDIGGVTVLVQAFVPYFFYSVATWGIGLLLNKVLGDKVPKEKKEKKAKKEEAAALPALEEGEESLNLEEDWIDDTASLNDLEGAVEEAEKSLEEINEELSGIQKEEK